jgi:hypothetical protein
MSGEQNIRDLESELDAALAKPGHAAPEIADLLAVVNRLQTLTPTPAPNLAKRKREFLNLAARRTASRRMSQMIWRPGFALIVVLVVLIAVGAQIGLSNQATLSPTTISTFTAAPTKTAMAPTFTPMAGALRATEARHVVEPKPVPTPARPFNSTPVVFR